MEVRTRSLTGNLSDAQQVCFDREALPVLDYTDELSWVDCSSATVKALEADGRSEGEEGKNDPAVPGEEGKSEPAGPDGETEIGGACSLTALAPTHWSRFAMLGFLLPVAVGLRRSRRRIGRT